MTPDTTDLRATVERLQGEMETARAEVAAWEATSKTYDRMEAALEEISGKLECNTPCVPRAESSCSTCNTTTYERWCAGCTARAALASKPAPATGVIRDMTDSETAAHIREWCKTNESPSFAWPTDACGYAQHIRFVDHRNQNWHGGSPDQWRAFVLAYADSLVASKPAPGAGDAHEPTSAPVNYRVWDCKIVVPVNVAMPMGFDYPPRRAAIDAVEAAGVEVVACFSGWGGTLEEKYLAVIENRAPRPPAQPVPTAGEGDSVAWCDAKSNGDDDE